MLFVHYFTIGSPANSEERCLLCVNDHLTAPLAHVDQEEDLEEVSSEEDYSDNRSVTNPWSGVSRDKLSSNVQR